MDKKQIIEAIAKKAGLSKKDATNAVVGLLDLIKSELSKGRQVSFIGFGSFIVAKRKAREGRNPKTGETIKIPAGKVPRFRPGKSLKDAVK